MAVMTNRSIVEQNSLWGTGHILFLLASILYVLTGGVFFYKYGVVALCVALFLEVYAAIQSSKEPVVDLLASNEIMPNLFLACYLFLIGANPIGVILMPWALQSLVKSVQAARQHPRITSHQAWKSYVQPLAERVLAAAPSILHQSLQLQVLVLPWLLLSIFSIGLLPILVYVGVLRWSCLVDGRMRAIMGSWDAWITALVERPVCPKMVRKWVSKAQMVVKSCSKLTPAHPPVNTNSNARTARPVSR